MLTGCRGSFTMTLNVSSNEETGMTPCHKYLGYTHRLLANNKPQA